MASDCSAKKPSVVVISDSESEYDSEGGDFSEYFDYEDDQYTYNDTGADEPEAMEDGEAEQDSARCCAADPAAAGAAGHPGGATGRGRPSEGKRSAVKGQVPSEEGCKSIKRNELFACLQKVALDVDPDPREYWLMHISIENRAKNMTNWIRRHALKPPADENQPGWRFIKGDATEKRHGPNPNSAQAENPAGENQAGPGPKSVTQAENPAGPVTTNAPVEQAKKKKRVEMRCLTNLYVGRFNDVGEISRERIRIYDILTGKGPAPLPRGRDETKPQYPHVIMAKAELYDEDYLDRVRIFKKEHNED
eukprot:scpid84247/ scgid16439/ 